ncbi:MAG: hypothetical protein SO122_03185 [Eubacteriales bacterium]|nr:hypothetical protein [Eubacteriales bacterium]
MEKLERAKDNNALRNGLEIYNKYAEKLCTLSAIPCFNFHQHDQRWASSIFHY